jgi:hypothetical protein
MARFLFVALSALVACPAAGQPAPKDDAWRIRELPVIRPASEPWGAAVGSGRIGVGMYGLKSQTPYRPVTVEEVTAPKSRRPGVGFSLKF